MRPKLSNIILGAALTVTAATGTVYMVHAYQEGTRFQPFSSSRALRNDQLLFPENEDSTLEEKKDEEKQDDSFWEQDAEETTGAQAESDAADYLFENESQPMSMDQLEDADIPVQNIQLGAVDTAQASSHPAEPNPGSENSVQITADHDGSTDFVVRENGETTLTGKPGSGSAGGSGSSGGSGSGAGSAGGSGAGGGSGTSGGTNAGGAGTGNAAGGGSTGTGDAGSGDVGTGDEDVKYNHFAESVKDPETEKKEPSFPAGTMIPMGPGAPTPDGDNGSLWIHPTMNDEQLYAGQIITDRTLFRAFDTAILERNGDAPRMFYWSDEHYGLEKLFYIDAVSFDGGESFRSDFPLTIPSGLQEGQMKIRCHWRIRTKDAWNEEIVDYQPVDTRFYVLKSVLKGEHQQLESEDLLNKDKTSPELDTTVNLYAYQEWILPELGESLNALFPGWTEYGKKVAFVYTIETAGRHVLEPLPMRSYDIKHFDIRALDFWVGEDYYATRREEADDTPGQSLCVLQTLTEVYPAKRPSLLSRIREALQSLLPNTLTGEGTEETAVREELLEVPEAVQAVDFRDAEAPVTVQELKLPDSVIYLNGEDPKLTVEENYTVADGNPRYTSLDGILYNADETELLGVPSLRTELSVPSGVQKIQLPENNQVHTLVLHSKNAEELPEINFDRLSDGSTIVLPQAVIADFIKKEQEVLRNRNFYIAPLGDQDTAYTIENGTLLSADGTVMGILYHGADAISLPEGAKRIAKEALAAHTDAHTLILPSNGNPVELREALTSSGIRTIYCYTETQKNAAMKAVAGTGVDVLMLTKTKSGYTYYPTDEGLVLVHVPSDLTRFDGKILDVSRTDAELPLLGIADGAFAGCSTLQWVWLPDSVQHIGAQSFFHCEALEGILIDARENIIIGKDAFEKNPALRFVASNAHKATFLNDYAPTLETKLPLSDRNVTESFLFCLDGAEDYPENWDHFTKFYDNKHFDADDIEYFTLQDVGEEHYVLFGASEGEGSWIALRTGKTMPEDVQLPENCYAFYYASFMDTVSESTAGYRIELLQNGFLRDFMAAAFYHSALSGDFSCDGFGRVGDVAFAKCEKLQRVTLDMDIFYLGNGAFREDTALTEVTLGNDELGISATFDNHMFYGCPKLQKIYINSITPPALTIYDIMDNYSFYAGEEGAEGQNLRITVPAGCEEAYITAWLDAFMGTSATQDTTAYHMLRETLANRYPYPSTAELDEMLFERRVNAENEIRTLLGMETITGEDLTFCNTQLNWLGMLTLTSVYSPETALTLDAPTLGFPEGWYLDSIGEEAFQHAPNLEDLYVEDNVSSIESGAFRNADHEIMLHISKAAENSTVPALERGLDDNGEWLPFDFTGLASVDVSEGEEESYLQSWTFPAAGYVDEKDMYNTLARQMADPDDIDEEGNVQISDELNERVLAEMDNILLPSENEVRKLLGMEETDTLTIELKHKEDKKEEEVSSPSEIPKDEVSTRSELSKEEKSDHASSETSTEEKSEHASQKSDNEELSSPSELQREEAAKTSSKIKQDRDNSEKTEDRHEENRETKVQQEMRSTPSDIRKRKTASREESDT